MASSLSSQLLRLASTSGLIALSIYTPASIFTSKYAEVLPVTGRSMSPTLSPDYHTAGERDHIWFNKRLRLRDDPYCGTRSELQRGMIIAFRAPHDPEKSAIKRIVALEGDMVLPLRASGLNGAIKGGSSLQSHGVEPSSPTPVTVPFGHVWVEGDNAEHSFDSNDYGPISRSLISGVATHIVWPSGRRGEIDWQSSMTPSTNARVKVYAGDYAWPDEWAY